MPSTPGALLVTPEGEVREIDLPDGGRARMDLMYELLETGEYDVVRVTTAIDMWIDGEFLYTANRKRPNPFATLFLANFGTVTQMICGPVLITGSADGEGETLPLTRDKMLAVLTKMSEGAERLLKQWPGA